MSISTKVNLKRCCHMACENPNPGTTMQKCVNCRHAVYCSQKCQRAAWPLHRTTCMLNKTKGGRLPEVAGCEMSGLLMCSMFSVVDQGLCAHIPRAEELITDMPGIAAVCQNPSVENIMLQAQLLSTVYTQLSSGKFDILEQYIKTDRPTQTDYVKTIRSWATHRVTDELYICCARKDGTVLVSSDFKRVYLVLGFLKSVAELTEGAAMVLFHITLLPWNGLISYDRLMRGSATAVDPEWKVKALAAYHAALEDKTLVTQLAEPAPTNTGAEAAASADVADETLKLTAADKSVIAGITAKNYRVNPNLQMWVMRRVGYSEATNPEHAIGVMSLPSSLFLTNAFLDSLEPTLPEIIKLFESAAAAQGCLSPNLAVDYLPVVEPLKAALKPLGVFVGHYPPPSQEEANLMNFHVAM